MQEKKNKRLTFLLLVLIGAVIGVYWLGKEDATFQVDKKLFNNYDLELIDEVQLESPEGKIKLSYTGSRWMVNDQYQADRDMIRVLFATLQKAEPKRPVATSLQDSISDYLGKNGVKISLLMKSEGVENFIVGGNERKTETYFKKVTEDVPYVMTIPGYRVYVGGIFELDENGWRDKYVFNFNWRNFSKLEVQFRKPGDNFTVTMDEGGVHMKELALPDTAKLNTFMDQISLLTVTEYLASTPQLDSLATTDPLIQFMITDIGGKQYELSMFPATERQLFYGRLNKSQWAIFQENRIIPLLRRKEFFIKR